MNIAHNRLSRRALALALLSAIALQASAQAQDQAAQATEQKEKKAATAQELDRVDVKVTARKRTESIINVPMNITAINAQELKDRNLVNVQEIYRTIAGGASATGQLILRGLAGGNTASPGTTSQFVDGIPFEFSNIFDVSRVEVLRGPQGTLWGSNAIGGTVQIITNKPDASQFSAFGSLQLRNQNDVAGVARRIEAGINVPLVQDRLALRLVGSAHDTPGQIVNEATGKQASYSGQFVRAQLQWQPVDAFQANLGYIHVNDRSNGRRFADRSRPGGYDVPTFTANAASPWGFDVGYDHVDCNPTWERARCFTGDKVRANSPSRYTVYERLDQWSRDTTDLVSLAMGYDDLFGIASINYVGSWRHLQGKSLDDWSRLDMNDLMDAWILNDTDSRRVTHELRIQNNERQAGFNWTLGMFMDRSWEPYNPNGQYEYYHVTPQNIATFSDWNSWAWGPDWAARGINNVAQMGQVLYGDPSKIYNYTVIHSDSKETAFFGELNYQLETGAGKFEFAAGLRKFKLEDYSHYTLSGLWIGPVDTDSTLAGSESGYRKKLSASWQPNENMNLYALYSEGYRPGGNNGPLPNACLADPFSKSHRPRYTSDSIDNYEIGLKGNVLDRKLRFATAVYQIDWADVRTSIYMPACGFSFMANAANARSRGIELESAYWIGENTSLTVNGSYTNSIMLSDVEALGAKKGDDMTMVPKYNAYFALDHRFQLWGRDTSARIDMATYGPYKSHFNVRNEDRSPGYTTFNLSGQMRLNDKMSVGAFINNLFDRQYLTYRGARSRTSNASPLNELYGEGRTIGLRLDLSTD